MQSTCDCLPLLILISCERRGIHTREIDFSTRINLYKFYGLGKKGNAASCKIPLKRKRKEKKKDTTNLQDFFPLFLNTFLQAFNFLHLSQKAEFSRPSSSQEFFASPFRKPRRQHGIERTLKLIATTRQDAAPYGPKVGHGRRCTPVLLRRRCL